MKTSYFDKYYKTTEELLADNDVDFALVIIEIIKLMEEAKKSDSTVPMISTGALTEDYTKPYIERGTHLDQRLHKKFRHKVEDTFDYLKENKLIKQIRDQSEGYFELTDKGRAAKKDQALLIEGMNYYHEPLLHSDIIEKTKSSFRSGQYDLVVESAWKQITVKIKVILGSKDMKDRDVLEQAFKDNSPLKIAMDKLPKSASNNSRNLSEAITNCFNLYRHGSAHNNITFDPKIAAELIIIASHFYTRICELEALIELKV